VSYRDWEAEAWFSFRMESDDAGVNCTICYLPIEPGDLAYLDQEDESPEFAHLTCAHAMVKCACCGGTGWHSLPDRHPVYGLPFARGFMHGQLGCKACEGRGFNPAGVPCWAPGVMP
jgi:hypothetical protein